MQVNFEHLELLPKLFEELKTIKLQTAINTEKRWLNIKELSNYIGYSQESINKMVKNGTFINGIHYYKPQRKLIFDKFEIDNWIVGISAQYNQRKVDAAIEDILQGVI